MSDIQIPTFSNVSSGGFTPAVQEQNTNVALGASVLPAVIQTAAKVGTSMLATAREKAYVQGQVDYYAKNIQEHSWLTQDAYEQGLRVSDFSEGMLSYQSKVTELARSSAEAGDSLSAFTEKMSPLVQDMQQRVQNSGLIGEARDSATKSILGNVASAQAMYQKELEAQAQRNQDNIANQIGTSAVINSLQPNADANVVAWNLDNTFDSVYSLHADTDPKTALSTASKKSYGAVAEIVSRLQSNSMQDLNKLKMLSGYLNTANAQRWTPDEREAALNLIDKKYQEFRQFQNVYDQENIRTLETNLNAGNAGIDDIRNMQSSLHSRIATGELDPAKGNAMLDKLHELSLKADKDVGDDLLITQGTYADWLRSGKGTDELLNKKVAQLVDASGNTTIAGAVLMKDSTRTNIPGEYQKGATLITQGFSTFLNTPASSITQVQESQAQALRAYTQAWAASADNPSQRDALVAALPKQWQGAMRQVLRDPNVDVTDARQLKGALDTARDGIEMQAKAGFNAEFTPDAFKSVFLGSTGGLGATLTNQPSDALLQNYAKEANSVLFRNKEYLASKGHLIVDEESATQALLQEGLAVRTKSGPVFLNPEFKASTGIDNTEQLSAVFDEVRQEIADKSGGRVKPENVRVVVAGNVATFVDYDDDNVPLRSYVQTPQDLNQRWQKKLEMQAITAPENVLDTTQAGNVTMNITRHWGTSLGSNDLGVKVAKHLAWYEGWTSDWKNTRSAEDQANPNLRQVEVIGPGITKQDHPEWVAKLDAAKGSPEKLSQVVGEFAGEYYKAYPDVVARAGIPSTTSIDRRPDVTYIAIADAMWHGGLSGGNAYADLVKLASTGRDGVTEALGKLKDLAVYKQAGPKRQTYLEHGLSLAMIRPTKQGY